MLTPRQKQCLDFIRDALGTRGVAPSYDEIRDGIGSKSKGEVGRLLDQLRDRGFITWRPRRARTILLTGKSVEPMPSDLPMVALSKEQAAEIDAIVASRNFPSREAVVHWLVECALWSWTHGSLPPIAAHNSAPFVAKAAAQ